MVAAQCHDAIAVTLLQFHDELEDTERVGASVAVVTQKDQLRILGIEIDGGERCLKSIKASVNVTHSEEMHL